MNNYDKVLSLIEENEKQNEKALKPKWNAPWELKKVISGHQGWVRAVDVDVSNEWFATGSTDRTVKIWDLASGKLKLTLTGHASSIRCLKISDCHPYMFTGGEDKSIKCWDLERNKVCRDYHGHLSGIYCLALLPKLNLVFSGGRDSSVRVWDMRTRTQIYLLSGHNETVASLDAQTNEPQLISGSMDRTIRLWDLRKGKSLKTLTHHKKSIRSIVFHPNEYSFVSGSVNVIKKWKCPDGQFIQNLKGHNSVINTLSINQDENILFSGGDDGKMGFWDYKTGYKFQEIKTIPQPGSLEAESGIFDSCFDKSGLRLITTEADKTIKIWGQNLNATEKTHPIKI